MKLYYTAGACSLFPHIVLCESDLEYQYEEVDLKKKITSSGADYYKINPKGFVPALELDDGSILTETVAIAQFLADRAKNLSLLPEVGELERYHVIEWLNYIGTEIHKGYGPLFRPDTSPACKEKATAKQYQRFEYINNVLCKHPYLVPSGYSLADIYLYVVMSWAKYFDLDLSPYTALVKHFNHIAERYAVKQARKEEGLNEHFTL